MLLSSKCPLERYTQEGLRTYKDTPNTTSEYYWEDNVLIRERETSFIMYYENNKETVDVDLVRADWLVCVLKRVRDIILLKGELSMRLLIMN